MLFSFFPQQNPVLPYKKTGFCCLNNSLQSNQRACKQDYFSGFLSFLYSVLWTHFGQYQKSIEVEYSALNVVHCQQNVDRLKE